MEDKKQITSRLYEDIKRIKGVDMTPGELSKAINESAQTVNNWTNRGVSNEGLIKCAVEFYGLDIYYIIKGERKVIKTDRRASSLKNITFDGLLKSNDPLNNMGETLLEIFLSLNDHSRELIQMIANKLYEFDHPTDSRATGKKINQNENEKQ